jgi:hypothetical protein
MSTLKVEMIPSFKVLETSYRATQNNSPEDHNTHFHGDVYCKYIPYLSIFSVYCSNYQCPPPDKP